MRTMRRRAARGWMALAAAALGLGVAIPSGVWGDSSSVPSDEEVPLTGEVCTHPFVDDETLISEFGSGLKPPASGSPSSPVRLLSAAASCDCDHDWSEPGEASKNPEARVEITEPAGNPAQIRIGTEQSFSAYGTFSDGIDVPADWSFVDVVKNEETYTWSNGQTGSSTSKKFLSAGGETMGVAYRREVEYRYFVSVTCALCGAVDGDYRTVSASDSDSASRAVKVYTLKLQISPAGQDCFGGSAAIGAGGLSSPAHQAEVKATLEPSDGPAEGFGFAVQFTDDDDPSRNWNGSVTATPEGEITTLTSSQRVGGGGTLKGTEPGVTASVSVSYEWSFSPSPTLTRRADGGLDGKAGVRGGGRPLDGHALECSAVEITVQRWDAEQLRLVEETRTEALPNTVVAATDGAGLAELVVPRPGERVLSARFLFYDRSVKRAAGGQ